MVYIGDSDTDIPCMKLVNSYGGHSIGVYNPDTKDKTKVYKMMRDNRIKYFAPADYSEGTELDTILKAIICKTAENEKLENICVKYKKEVEVIDKLDDSVIEKQERKELLYDLRNSESFATTHIVIKKMFDYDWNDDEISELFKIAIENAQVNWILKDYDVANFYKGLLENIDDKSENVLEVEEILFGEEN